MSKLSLYTVEDMHDDSSDNEARSQQLVMKTNDGQNNQNN